MEVGGVPAVVVEVDEVDVVEVAVGDHRSQVHGPNLDRWMRKYPMLGGIASLYTL